jgi:hypothetical protein
LGHTDKREESVQLAELKTSIRKLSEIHIKLAALMMRKFAARVSGSSFAKTMEGAENRVETFTKVLSKFVRLRKRLHTGMTILGNNLKTLENAESIGEISTLIGLTILGDQREYNEAATDLMKSYEAELLPIVPELTNLLSIGAQAYEAGKMMNRLINYDATTGEDDLIGMMTALRDHDIDKFNEIHNRMKRRIEAEERR